jgi:hypothetical protein
MVARGWQVACRRILGFFFNLQFFFSGAGSIQVREEGAQFVDELSLLELIERGGQT